MDKRKNRISERISALMERTGNQGIQSTVLVSFTVISVLIVVLLGFSLYQRFMMRTRVMMTESMEQLMSQTEYTLEDYLTSMRRISDAMYYDAIKDKDLAKDSLDGEMSLLYEANKDNLVSFAVFRRDGLLVSASPVSTMKADLDVREEPWFNLALEKPENLHFSTPHVQNIFDASSFRYYWVISLSRIVELTSSGVPMRGVLLVDMNYSTIEEMMNRVNNSSSYQYFYLCDGNGELIYHPRMIQIGAGKYKENSLNASDYEDGVHEEFFEGERRVVIVKTISYTGWKLVGVIPTSGFRLGAGSTQYFTILVLLATILALLVIYRLVTNRITSPILRLSRSIQKMEGGRVDPDSVYIGGPTEVRQLGRSLQGSFRQVNALMEDVVREQEERRRSELDALQSQINPHFLYNTLDSIVWMIEGERNDDAVFMVTQLASLFRISLSKGRTVISIKDELIHARNYMNIQKVRYKEAFEITWDISEEILDYCTVKLVVQPILENALYYGIDAMGDEGEILVRGTKKGGDIYIAVSDNGLGMPKETVDQLLVDEDRVRSHGSGVGLINVHKRIMLRFGRQYGLMIESEPDEGTTVTIHLPAVPYTEENRKKLEHGQWDGEGER
ncbi:MAG TPA: histidine kinase [Lachnospiraceae bacterium]|nr:histidine kinase [Lachnospiraceae bacterium]